MKIGIIYVGFQCEDLIQRSLTPWTQARAERLGGVDWKIAAVSLPFDGFNHEGESMDDTHKILRDCAMYGEIDHLIADTVPTKETDARGAALHWLVNKAEVDILWMVDADEEYSLADIHAILTFVRANSWVAWYRVSFKNMVFTEHQYLMEPFTPPRIHRVDVAGLKAAWFWDDNNVAYKTIDPGRIRKDIELASLTIPETVAFVPHLSWLNNERSRKKINYQLNGRGWPECSFSWDDARGGLIFNESYYAKRGLPLPEVVTLDTKV